MEHSNQGTFCIPLLCTVGVLAALTQYQTTLDVLYWLAMTCFGAI